MPNSLSGVETDPRAEARLLLRRWLAADDNGVLAAIDALGKQAIGAAAEASIRLERAASSTEAAAGTLSDLQSLMLHFEAPPRRTARSFFTRGTASDDDVRARIETLVEKLDTERDAIARSLIAIDTDCRKLRIAAAALDDTVSLIRACAAALDAAARELAFDQPTRAGFLNDTARARLLSREQDVLTQAAVTQQGILTLQMLRDGQEALAQALARARDTSIAALRTAIATRRAIAGSQDMARQAEALEQTARAAQDAPTPRGDLQRALDDALDQARHAILAAQAAQRDTRL